jgi:hypothetical protein
VRKLLVAVVVIALVPWLSIAGTASAATGCASKPGVVQIHWLTSGIHYQPSAIDGDGRLSSVELLGHEGTPKLVSVWQCTDGSGAWAVTPEGHVYIGGTAQHFGHALGTALMAPIVGMAMTPTGLGYWLVASDGGIFAYGDATYLGSTGATKLNSPIVAMASTPTGKGYWLTASDGGVFTFGDATYLGSMGATPLNQPIVGMVATTTGRGYWMVASDGGVFTFGDADYLGSNGGEALTSPIAGMIPNGDGYSVVDLEGTVTTFGSTGTTTTTGGDHDHHGDDGATDGSTDVDTSGPIISVDDPRLTESQRAAAISLIDRTVDGMAKYPDEAAVKKAGFLSIGDSATGFEHYVNWTYLLDSHEMDPNHIESVVLRVADDGTKTVESAMYILSVGKTMADVPDIAGTLTTFHKHDDLCFSGTRVVALASDAGCPGGTILLVTPPMLHVWLTPQECGPFAGIETGNHGTSCHVH